MLSVTDVHHINRISLYIITTYQPWHLVQQPRDSNPQPPIYKSVILIPHPITLDPTPKKRPIVPQPKLRPIVRQPVITPEPAPHQFIVLGRTGALAAGAEGQLHRVRVLWIHAFGFDGEVTFGLDVIVGFGGRISVGGGRRKFPPAPQGIFHHDAGQSADDAAAVVHVFSGEVVDHVDGYDGGEQGDAGAVAEEAQIAVVGYDMHGGIPGDLGGGRGAGADIIDFADVAAVKAEAGADVEHVRVGWVDLGEWE